MMFYVPQIFVLTYHQAASKFSWFDFQQENLDHSELHLLFLTKNGVLLYDHLTYSPDSAPKSLQSLIKPATGIGGSFIVMDATRMCHRC